MTVLVDRRRFIVGASGVALGAAVPGLALSQAPGDDNLYTGLLQDVLGRSAAVIRLTVTGATQRVEVRPDADILHGLAGHTRDLLPFVPGEGVVFRALPADRGKVWRTAFFQSLLGGTTAHVVSPGSELIATDGRRIIVAPAAREAAEAMAKGDSARVTFWTHPASGVRYAQVVKPD